MPTNYMLNIQSESYQVELYVYLWSMGQKYFGRSPNTQQIKYNFLHGKIQPFLNKEKCQ